MPATNLYDISTVYGYHATLEDERVADTFMRAIRGIKEMHGMAAEQHVAPQPSTAQSEGWPSEHFASTAHSGGWPSEPFADHDLVFRGGKATGWPSEPSVPPFVTLDRSPETAKTWFYLLRDRGADDNSIHQLFLLGQHSDSGLEESNSLMSNMLRRTGSDGDIDNPSAYLLACIGAWRKKHRCPNYETKDSQAGGYKRKRNIDPDTEIDDWGDDEYDYEFSRSTKGQGKGKHAKGKGKGKGMSKTKGTAKGTKGTKGGKGGKAGQGGPTGINRPPQQPHIAGDSW